jgi:hypothetical protein
MTDILDLVQLSANNNMGAAQMLLDVGDAAMLFNTSTEFPFFIGNNPALTPSYPNAVEIQPLGYLVITAVDQPIYGVCNSGEPLTVAVLPGAEAFFTPQMDATITGPVEISSGSVNATIVGTPEVDLSGPVTFTNTTIDVVGSGGLFPVGGSSALVSGFAAVPVSTSLPVQVGDCSSYTAFNLLAAAYCTSQSTAGAPLTCLVELQWFADSGYTIQIDDDAGWIWVTNSSTVNLTNAYVKGPMQGRYLQIVITNPSSTEPLVCNYSFYGTGRSLTVSEWWQPAPVGGSMNSGVTMMLGTGISPTDGSSDDILAATGATAVAASVTVWQPLPLKSPCLSSWNFVASVALSSFFALNMAAKLVNGQVSAGSPQPTTLWVPGNTAATNYTTQLALPHAPTFFVIHTTATPATVSVVAAASDV